MPEPKAVFVLPDFKKTLKKLDDSCKDGLSDSPGSSHTKDAETTETDKRIHSCRNDIFTYLSKLNKTISTNTQQTKAETKADNQQTKAETVEPVNQPIQTTDQNRIEPCDDISGIMACTPPPDLEHEFMAQQNRYNLQQNIQMMKKFIKEQQEKTTEQQESNIKQQQATEQQTSPEQTEQQTSTEQQKELEQKEQPEQKFYFLSSLLLFKLKKIDLCF